MRTASRAVEDLTARARIRDAAIDCFADVGFGASFRTIAARAGVSPGLITHHFGSKEALRAECDTEVLRRYRELQADAADDISLSMVGWLAEPGPSSTLAVYFVRCVHAGGESAQVFFDHLLDEARVALVRLVERGLLRPSRDEEARLRYLGHQSLGTMLVQLVLHPGLDAQDLAATLHQALLDSLLPMLELYTTGLLTGTQLLDDYLAYLTASSDEVRAGPAPPAA